MIDWVTAVLPLNHDPLNAGHVLKILPSGEVDWQTSCRISVEGSYESSIQVRSEGGDGEGRAEALLLSGNPSKFLQGHNIFGSDDLVSIVYDAYLIICGQLGLKPTVNDLHLVRSGQYRITRVDVNYSYDLRCRADVLAWIRAAEFKSKTRHGRPSSKGGTLYWGKTSKRWSLKAYSKGEEIQRPKHGLPDELRNTLLPSWADKKLRIELVLRSKELDEIGLSEAHTWKTGTAKTVFEKYIVRIDMSAQMVLKDERLNDLPHNVRGTYLLWREGHDLRSTLPKATYYRHRKQLMSIGINIDLCREASPGSNVIPLIKVLEAKPSVIPDWAFEQNLIHPSASISNACSAHMPADLSLVS